MRLECSTCILCQPSTGSADAARIDNCACAGIALADCVTCGANWALNQEKFDNRNCSTNPRTLPASWGVIFDHSACSA